MENMEIDIQLCDTVTKESAKAFEEAVRIGLDRGILTYQHQTDALEYTISLIQIEGEVN